MEARLATSKEVKDLGKSWRAILKLRDEARKFIKFEGIGSKICSRAIYDAASNPEAKVDFVLKDKTWIWRPARSDALLTIQCQLFLIELKDEDKALWQATKSGKFSCAATYTEIRDKSSEVEWWKLLWFHLTILKHSFIGWLAVINKLSTLDTMTRWGYSDDSICVFCRNFLERRDHIFFECSFTRRIWDDMMKLCLVSNAQFILVDLMAWGSRELKGKGLRVIACKLAQWPMVYHIWLQRNAIVDEERIWTE
ncbi:uncharacterized protein LOC142613508 [Castanea sativa]|uniref:uncharacterized protein LOC142613508 n=1 Tax=Castanea sativa TaxID=21020 RepID=UPI003F652336